MKKLAILVGFLALTAVASFAATSDSHTVNLTLNAIATVRINPTGAISLAITDPATAGSGPTDVTDGTKYLQYTVVSGTPYRITVAAAGSIPAGTVLSVEAAAPVGATGTSAGTSVGPVTLTNGMSAATVLSNIQDCYTGVGGSSGANLTYTFGVGGTFGDEVPGSGSVVVTYTLSTP